MLRRGLISERPNRRGLQAAGVPAERDPAEREAFKLKVLSAMTFKPEGVDLRLRSRSLLQGLAKVLSWSRMEVPLLALLLHEFGEGGLAVGDDFACMRHLLDCV